MNRRTTKARTRRAAHGVSSSRRTRYLPGSSASWALRRPHERVSLRQEEYSRSHGQPCCSSPRFVLGYESAPGHSLTMSCAQGSQAETKLTVVGRRGGASLVSRLPNHRGVNVQPYGGGSADCGGR